MEIMNICVLHLSDVERDTGSGVDREELIQWYLEQKETEFETEEDLEYERELIAKALTKLSRVSLFLTRGNKRLYSFIVSSSSIPPFHLLFFCLPVFLQSFYP
jgi:DNA replication licensing factor MCM6